MPVEVTLLSSSSTALTPTTAPARNSSSVVSGLSRLTPPSLSTSTSSFGTAPTSAFRPSCNACLGVSPGPTPPFFSPTIALCSWSWSPQKASLPNVSQRKIFLPSAMSCCEFSVTLSSHSSRGAACVRAAGSVSTSFGSERHAPTTNKATDAAINGRATCIIRLLRKHTPSQSCRPGKVPPGLQGSRRFPLCLQLGTEHCAGITRESLRCPSWIHPNQPIAVARSGRGHAAEHDLAVTLHDDAFGDVELAV